MWAVNERLGDPQSGIHPLENMMCEVSCEPIKYFLRYFRVGQTNLQTNTATPRVMLLAWIKTTQNLLTHLHKYYFCIPGITGCK